MPQAIAVLCIGMLGKTSSGCHGGSNRRVTEIERAALMLSLACTNYQILSNIKSIWSGLGLLIFLYFM